MNRIVESRKEVIIDIVKEVLIDAVVVALAFVYWMAMLLLLSLFLINVWVITFVQILRLAILFTIVSGIVYIAFSIRKKTHVMGNRI